MGKRTSGVFAAHVHDTLLIVRPERHDTIHVHALDIVRLEVARGKQRRAFARHGLVGLLSGAALGAIVGAANLNDRSVGGDEGFILFTAMAGGIVGGVTGLIVAIPPRTNWVSVDPRALQHR